MQKLSILICLLLCFSTGFTQNCVPDGQYTTPGIYPDSITGMPDSPVDSSYAATITLVLESETTEDMPGVGIVTLTINYSRIDSIVGLPPGFTYACEPSNCQIAGGSSGCILISGQCTSEGLYNFTIYVTANVTHALLGTFDAPQGITYNHVTVGTGGGGGGGGGGGQFTLLNSGFEDWHSGSGYEDPDNWNTLNPNTGILSVYTVSKSTDVHSGNYAIELETKFIGPPFNQSAVGMATTGTINSTTQVIDGGVVYNDRPDSISGWFKYAPVNIDTATIEVFLLNTLATDTLGHAKFTTSATVSSYTFFSAPFEYYSLSTPGLAQVNIYSSSQLLPEVGSILHVDDLGGFYMPCSAGFNLYPDSVIAHNWFAQNTCTGNGPLDYTWYWGDGDSTSGSNPSHTYSTPGYYNICVEITAANGCTDSYCDSSVYIYKTDAEMISVTVVGGPTGIEEMAAHQLKLYPNPATNIITIETGFTKGIYQLHDITGKTLLQGSVNTTKFTLDISSFSSGVYFISVSDGDKQVYGKVVKE